MRTCPHCGHNDESNAQECPSCGQFVAPAAEAPAPYMTHQAAPTPAPTTDASSNPYAAPRAATVAANPYGYGYTPPHLLPTSGKAIASLVLGILSIVIYFLGFILGPLAIGLWASARNDFKQMPPTHKGQGMATAGLATGIIGTLIGLLMVGLIIFAIAFTHNESQMPPP